MRKLAIVILNWNGSGLMQKYLPSVIQNSHGDVIVADNASTDDSVVMLKREFPDTRLIILDKNYGFAEGYNRSLAQLQDEYEYLLLLNSDVEIRQKDWDKILTDYMDEHPECAAVMPKLLKLTTAPTAPNPTLPPVGEGAARCYSDKNSDRLAPVTLPLRGEGPGLGAFFEYAGASGGFLDRYAYPFCRGRIFDTVEEDKGQYDTVTSVLWATGASLLVRTSDWIASGGLDSRFFAHMEEIDLCWRLRTMGRDIVCIPQSTAYHLGGASLNYGNPRKTYLNFRNNLLMIYKNAPENRLGSILRVRFLLDLVAATKFLVSGQAAHFKAIVRAIREFYRIRHDWDAERTRIQSIGKGREIKEVTDYSILLKYYSGKKRYSQI